MILNFTVLDIYFYPKANIANVIIHQPIFWFWKEVKKDFSTFQERLCLNFAILELNYCANGKLQTSFSLEFPELHGIMQSTRTQA
jgi:hypothetical protein